MFLGAYIGGKMAENEPKTALLCVLDARMRFSVLVGWTFIRVVNSREREPIFTVFTLVLPQNRRLSKLRKIRFFAVSAILCIIALFDA